MVQYTNYSKQILCDRRHEEPLFIWGLLQWTFSALFFSDASLWSQDKFIAFNIFSYKSLIISCKISMITVISIETTNELTIHWLFHNGGPFHVETSPLSCSANQWTGFYMIGTSIMTELSIYLEKLQYLPKRAAIFHRQELAFLFQVQVKIKAVREFKIKLFK